MANPIAHNLAPGFYLVDHTTGTVQAGPFGSRNQVLSSDARGTGPCVLLEVVGDVVPWLGGAVGNVCVTCGEYYEVTPLPDHRASGYYAAMDKADEDKCPPTFKPPKRPTNPPSEPLRGGPNLAGEVIPDPDAGPNEYHDQGG